MSDDSDQIFVDVVPKLNDSETEKSVSRLRDKFKDGAKGVGKSIGDTLHSELSRELDRTKDLLGNFGKTDFAGALGGVKDTMTKMDDLAKNLGVDLSEWTGKVDKTKAPIDDLGVKTKDVLSSVKDVSSTFEGMPGKIGAAALKAGELATKIGAVVELGHELYEQFGQPLDIKISESGGFGKWLQEHTHGDIGKDLADSLGADRVRAWMGKTFGYDPEMGNGPLMGGGGGFGAGPQAYPPGFIGPVSPGSTRNAPTSQPPSGNPYKDWYGSGAPAHTSSAITGPGTHARLVDYTTPSTPTIGSPSDIPQAAGGVANLYRFAEGLVGTPYSTSLRNDCSGMISELANVAVGLPPDTGGRFSTANEGSRLAGMGFQPGLGGPNDFNVGWYNGGPGGGHTAATLPGGVNAEQGGSHGSFTLGPGAAGAGNPEFTNHAYLPMGMGGGGRGGSFLPAGMGNIPLGPGAPGGPGMPGGGGLPNLSGKNSASPAQQQQEGSGSGFGLTGGGLIGFAEQLPGMAASAAGGAGGAFGGGAAGAAAAAAYSDFIEPQINLAIEEGGKAAAVAAMIPTETTKLSGGQMGAPTVGQGWYAKLVGPLIGQGFSAINSAGAGAGSTQKPAQPQDSKDAGDANGGGGDPLNGSQQPGQNAQNSQGGKPPPTGHANDPIHVAPAPGAGGSQGGATSAMNATGVQSAISV